MIIKTKDLAKIRHQYKNKAIVFASGVFDLFHIGHLKYLESAKKLGEILVVNVVNNKRVRYLKGVTRPITSEENRAKIIDSLKFVDYVVINRCVQTGVSISCLKKLNPNVFAVENDNCKNTVLKLLPTLKLVRIPRTKDISTSLFINKYLNNIIT